MGALEAFLLGLVQGLGLTDALCAELAPMAKADPSDGGNPLTLEVADYEALYRASLGGVSAG